MTEHGGITAAQGDSEQGPAGLPEEPLKDIPYEDESRIGGPPAPPEDVLAGRVNGGPVLDHVQQYADALCAAISACTISTYEGHHPDRTRALDILVSSAYGVMPGDNFRLGDKVASFTFEQWSSFEVWYIIWRQRINSNDGRGWRAMEDRGSIIQNHFDHCHVSFEAGGWVTLPTLSEGDTGPAVTYLQQLLNNKGHTVDVDGIFGPQTAGAVVAFQTSRGLDPDAIVGPLTWAALRG